MNNVLRMLRLPLLPSRLFLLILSCSFISSASLNAYKYYDVATVKANNVENLTLKEAKEGAQLILFLQGDVNPNMMRYLVLEENAPVKFRFDGGTPTERIVEDMRTWWTILGQKTPGNFTQMVESAKAYYPQDPAGFATLFKYADTLYNIFFSPGVNTAEVPLRAEFVEYLFAHPALARVKRWNRNETASEQYGASHMMAEWQEPALLDAMLTVAELVNSTAIPDDHNFALVNSKAHLGLRPMAISAMGVDSESVKVLLKHGSKIDDLSDADDNTLVDAVAGALNDPVKYQDELREIILALKQVKDFDACRKTALGLNAFDYAERSKLILKLLEEELGIDNCNE